MGGITKIEVSCKECDGMICLSAPAHVCDGCRGVFCSVCWGKLHQEHGGFSMCESCWEWGRQVLGAQTKGN